MLAVVLSLVAATSWGAADFLGGLATRERGLLAVLAISQVAGLVVLAIVALPLAGDPPSGADLVPAVAAGVVGVVGLGLLYLALAIGTMSIVAPVVAMSAVVPVFVSLAGGDRLSAAVAAGIVLALAGAAGAAAAADEPDAAVRARRARSLWVAAGAAVGVGLGLVLLDDAAEGGALWGALVARTCGVLTIGAAFAVRPAPLGLRDPGIGRVATIGVLDTAAITLFSFASNEGLLAVVAVLSSLYPVVTVILARVVLQERLRAIQVAGVAVAFVGIGLIASGS